TAMSDYTAQALTGPQLSAANLLKTPSGTLVAGVYSPVISITGSGYLRLLYAAMGDALAKDWYVRLIIDGVVVTERSIIGATTGGTNRGIPVVGAVFSTTDVDFANVRFNSSFVVEM